MLTKLLHRLKSAVRSPQSAVPTELPPQFGPRLTLQELQVHLQDPGNPTLRAIVQLIHYRRCTCVSSALANAYKEQPTQFDLGGAHYLDELYAEILSVKDDKPSSHLAEWFA